MVHCGTYFLHGLFLGLVIGFNLCILFSYIVRNSCKHPELQPVKVKIDK